MALNAKATQDFVPIKEIRDGIVLLKNGELRAIVLANSTNLSLKSSDEQQATIIQFQSFLNTLDFQVQISIQSRKLDIRPYLLLLENRMKVQNEPLLKLQTKEYMEFIRNFTETVSIMTKSFFVVVPYTQTSLKTDSSIFSNLFSKKNAPKHVNQINSDPITIKDIKRVIKAREKAVDAELWQRAMKLTDVLEYMPADKRNDWHEQIRKHKTPPFEIDTVYATLKDLLVSRERFLAERVDGIFRNLSHSHVTNTPGIRQALHHGLHA